MIEFVSHEIDFILPQQESVRSWLLFFLKEKQCPLDSITYIFLSDDSLLKINQEHLQHDYYTDIITFPYHNPGEPVFSDIYISLDRVKENAQLRGLDLYEELHRVMVHGILHLLGYDDHTEEDVLAMRSAEDRALSLWPSDVPRGT